VRTLSHVFFFLDPSPVRRVPIPNRYTAKAKLCFCKNNKRSIIVRRSPACIRLWVLLVVTCSGTLILQSPKRERDRERERERELYQELLLWSITGGLGRSLRTDSASPCAFIHPTHPWWSSILHGEDFPRTVMRGLPDGAVEPVLHGQETLDLVA
jgi:hypothetical protein